jgi:hypothetical protein
MTRRIFHSAPGIQLIQTFKPGGSSEIILWTGLASQLIACTYCSTETAKLIFDFLVENPDSYLRLPA